MPAGLKLFPEVMSDANFRLTLRVMSSFHLHYHTYKLQNKSLISENNKSIFFCSFLEQSQKVDCFKLYRRKDIYTILEKKILWKRLPT